MPKRSCKSVSKSGCFQGLAWIEPGKQGEHVGAGAGRSLNDSGEVGELMLVTHPVRHYLFVLLCSLLVLLTQRRSLEQRFALIATVTLS